MSETLKFIFNSTTTGSYPLPLTNYYLWRPVAPHDLWGDQHPEWQRANEVYYTRKRGKLLTESFVKCVFRGMGGVFGDEPVYRPASFAVRYSGDEKQVVYSQYPYARMENKLFIEHYDENAQLDVIYETRKSDKYVTKAWTEVLMRRHGYSAA